MLRLRIHFAGLTLLLLFSFGCVPNNAPLGPEQLNLPPEAQTVELEVVREGVYILQGSDRTAVSASEQVAPLDMSQGVAVDAVGRAILHFEDRLTLELLQNGELLQIQQFNVDGPAAVVTVAQNGGALIADLNVSPGNDTSLTVQTAFATINANNARFAVVRESDSPLEWLLGLEVPENGQLTVTVAGQTYPVEGGQARWISLQGEPGSAIVINQNVQDWLENTRNDVAQPELGELILAPADILADSGSLDRVPPLGRPVEFGSDVKGAVNLTLDPLGIFGAPEYTLEDCNNDGVPDLAVRNGKLSFDFRPLLARVQAINVTLLNRDAPGQGLLQALDPSGAPINQQQLEVAAGQTQTLSLRGDQPFHAALLTLANACFLGYSLIPPGQPDRPIEARPIQENVERDVVVNILAASAERLPENGQFEASPVQAGQIIIDGDSRDWDTLTAQNGRNWASFSTIIYDNGCANRFPESAGTTDLSGRVLFAYDPQNLYAAFAVSDDGLATYTGDDERFFLGDSPQLLLDLNLNGDFDSAQLSDDDVQLDLLPNPNNPLAALWRLDTLSSSRLTAVQIAVTPTDSGYFLEMAVPWSALGTTIQSGDRLGIVASISDNDTPAANAQECIISTAPNRDWRNPTTWGTVLLAP